MPARPPQVSGSLRLRSSSDEAGSGPIWPDPRPRLSEHLARRALVEAMDPRWEARPAAAALSRHAAGNQTALRRALGRIQRRSLERPTPVGARAAQALRLALEVGAGPPGSAGGYWAPGPGIAGWISPLTAAETCSE